VVESNTWTTVAYSGEAPKSSAPAGCVNDGNLITLSGRNDSVSFKQIQLPEREKAKSQEDLDADEEGTAIAHLRSLVNNQLMSDVTLLGKRCPQVKCDGDSFLTRRGCVFHFCSRRFPHFRSQEPLCALQLLQGHVHWRGKNERSIGYLFEVFG
jgi:hypothetical protein